MLLLENILLLAIRVYSWVLIAYILMSWFPNARETTIGEFLASIAEPYLEPFRRVIPPLGMLDFSPIVAILVLVWLVPQGIQFIFQLLVF